MIRRYWPRMAEALLGAWMAASPWVLPAAASAGPELRVAPVVAGVLLMALALASRRFPRVNVLVLATGALTILWNWMAYPRPGPPVAQNGIVVGLVVCLFALVPTDPGRPPRAWRPLSRDPFRLPRGG